MSIDTYSYPTPPKGTEQQSQRTSLQRGGFASMMDVLTQNEAMNQTDNDSFVVPVQEEVIQRSKNPIQAQTPIEEKTPEEVSTSSDLLVEHDSVNPEEIESVEVLSTPVFAPMEQQLHTPVPVLGGHSVDIPDVVTPVVPQEVQVPVVDVVRPVPQYTPAPKIEASVQVEVPFIEDVPEAIMEMLPKVIDLPKPENIVDSNPVHVPVEAAQVLPSLPQALVSPKELQRNRTAHESSKSIDEPKLAPRQVEVFASESPSPSNTEIEDDPKVRFVRYVEKELVTPKFAKGQDESLHIPEEMQLQKDVQNPNTPPSNGVLGAERSTRSVSVVTRAEGTQASSILEKGSTKEELKMPKRKLEQSFAKLLKEAKELAEDFEPEFHTKILKKLEIQVKDPAGMIQLEIAQKEAVIHVRAVVPTEAMSDLHYLGQDVQESLQDLGLQLGSYELRSQDDEEEHAGFAGVNEAGFDEIETEDVEITNSDYIVDKRV